MTAVEENRLGKHSPPVWILLSIVLIAILVETDERLFAGWLRLIAIVTSSTGLLLSVIVAAYWFNRLRPTRPGSILVKWVWGVCLVFCSWMVVAGLRDVRYATDPNRWLEFQPGSVSLPLAVQAEDAYYMIDLDTRVSSGLQRVNLRGGESQLWPDGQSAEEWFGWTFRIRNRGFRALSNIELDLPVSYSVGKSSTSNIRHIAIPSLTPNGEITLLLGSGQSDLNILVTKPRTFLAQVGNDPAPKKLKVLWLPFGKYFDQEDFFFLSGPRNVDAEVQTKDGAIPTHKFEIGWPEVGKKQPSQAKP